MENKNIDVLLFSIVGLVVLLGLIFYKLIEERRLRDKIARENAKLSAKNAYLEAEHLKFQLQPHTLRNMVATLHVASKNLYKGSEALAETLDYILYHGNEHLVSIQEELNFLENYKALQGNFIHQIDSIQIDTSQMNKRSKYFNSPCIPHLITAYFIENAFKHGDKNHPEFLKIRLKLSDISFELFIINRIKQLPMDAKGGIGLKNMQKRLDLLLPGKYQINCSCKEHEYYSSLKINF